MLQLQNKSLNVTAQQVFSISVNHEGKGGGRGGAVGLLPLLRTISRGWVV